MVDVDWPNLAFIVSVALVTGGIAFGAARARSQAFEISARRELDALREDLRRLQDRFEACIISHSDAHQGP